MCVFMRVPQRSGGCFRGQLKRIVAFLLCVLGTELRLSALVANTFAFQAILTAL